MSLGHLQERVQVFCTRKHGFRIFFPGPEEMDGFIQGRLHILHC